METNWLQRFKPGINPIIVKELRSRMRGPRAFITLTAILVLLGGASYALAQMVIATSRYSSAPLSPQIGQALFAGLVYLELLMIAGITPAITAGGISGEQEKLTYEMLLSTPLRPASILWGKLVSALSYVFLLLFAGVPMASLVFIFGGVNPRDMLKALVILIVVAVMVGVLGLFMSALFRRTGRATVATYVVVLALLIGPLFLTTASAIIRANTPPRWLLVPSPMAALASAITNSSRLDGPMSLFWILGGSFWGLGMQAPISQTGIPRPLYHYSLPLFALITLVLYLLATRLVLPTRRWKLELKEALVGLGLVALVVGASAAFFFATSNRYENFRNIFAAPTPVAPMGMAMPAAVAERRVAVVEAAPVDGEATPTPEGEASAGQAGAVLSAEDQAAAYAAVLRQVFTADAPDFAAGGPPVAYLLATTDDSVGDPEAPQGEPQAVPEEVQTRVLDALADLPLKLQWVASWEETPVDFTSSASPEQGNLVTLGNVHAADDGSLTVAVRVLHTVDAGLGRTYTLAPAGDGEWQVTGDTGFEWTP